MSSSFTTGQATALAQAGQAVTAILGYKRNRRIVFSAGAGVFQRLVQVVATLIVMPLLIRVLGPAQFGVWGAAASLAWLTGLLDIGTGAALVTLVARSSAVDNAGEARRHIASALVIGSGLAILMLLTALVASIVGAPQGRAEPYLIAVVGLALNVPLNAANNVWMALQKGYVSGFWELVQTLLTVAGLVGAALFTKDVRVYVAVVYAGLVLSNLGSLVHLVVRHPELRPRALLVPLAAIREVAGSSIMYFLLGLTGGLSFVLDNVLALALLGPEASAQMTIALRICTTALGLLVVVSQPLWPAFTEAAESADRHWIRKTVLRAAALLVGISAAGSAILLVYGERLLRWWLHTNLGIGRALLWAISIWILAQAFSRVPHLLLNGLSIVRYQIAACSLATLLAFGLKIVMAPYLGAAGILWGTTATAFLIYLPAGLWRISRWAKHFARGVAVTTHTSNN
jgi:O-antigen/teichoic acid export membrane protein